MTMSVGDVSAAQPKIDLNQTRYDQKLEDDQSEAEMASFLKTNTMAADRSTLNLMRSEIKDVMSDALAVLKNSGREIRDSGR